MSILLVLVIGCLEPLHQHSDLGNRTSKVPCIVCISSQSGVPTALPNLLPLKLTLQWEAPEASTESPLRPALEHPFTRPPPAI